MSCSSVGIAPAPAAPASMTGRSAGGPDPAPRRHADASASTIAIAGTATPHGVRARHRGSVPRHGLRVPAPAAGVGAVRGGRRARQAAPHGAAGPARRAPRSRARPESARCRRSCRPTRSARAASRSSRRSAVMSSNGYVCRRGARRQRPLDAIRTSDSAAPSRPLAARRDTCRSRRVSAAIASVSTSRKIANRTTGPTSASVSRVPEV